MNANKNNALLVGLAVTLGVNQDAQLSASIIIPASGVRSQGFQP
ncbi:hypothetical protein [uncultured Thiodictyon sp.]|nr:hypothetical protein [uncultured Thiodictyon sp.]